MQPSSRKSSFLGPRTGLHHSLAFRACNTHLPRRTGGERKTSIVLWGWTCNHSLLPYAYWIIGKIVRHVFALNMQKRLLKASPAGCRGRTAKEQRKNRPILRQGIPEKVARTRRPKNFHLRSHDRYLHQPDRQAASTGTEPTASTMATSRIKPSGTLSGCVPCDQRKHCLRTPEKTRVRYVSFFRGEADQREKIIRGLTPVTPVPLGQPLPPVRLDPLTRLRRTGHFPRAGINATVESKRHRLQENPRILAHHQPRHRPATHATAATCRSILSAWRER